MKRFLTALALVVLLVIPAFAKDFVFNACTTDKQAVLLSISLTDNASKAAVTNVQEAFTAAAKQLTYEELRSNTGFQLFVNALSDDAKEAVQRVVPPAVDPSKTCK